MCNKTAPLSVLLIDDSPSDRALCRLYLEHDTHPFAVTEVDTAEQGLSLCRQQRFDCIVLDQMLPGMNGLGFLEQLHSECGQLPYPVVLLTGSRDEQVHADSIRLGAYYCLSKDLITPQGLARAIFSAAHRFSLGEQKDRAERALRQSEARSANIFATAPIGMALCDRDGGILDANTAFCQITGYTEQELRAFPYRNLLAPTDLTADAELQSVNLSAGTAASPSLEGRFLRKSGEVIPVRCRTSALGNDPSAVAQSIVLVEDITDTKRLEEQLRQSQKMEAIGRLAGGIAHDFNNLMTVVLGYGRMVAAELPPEPQLHQRMAEVLKAGERAVALTGQLLTFSRRQMLQPQTLDLNQVVIDMHELLVRLLGEDIVLHQKLGEGSKLVCVDLYQLEQVLLNLAVNARDAMPEGGSLLIETNQVAIDAQGAALREIVPGRYVQLIVSDSGCGIEPATLQHIFEPFFTTKAPGKGTGLGLATVYGIVKQTGGYVSVSSEPGHGTEFRIYLPEAKLKTARHPSVARVAAESTLLRGTVLVVEDEDAVRSLVKETLQECGCTVLTAANSTDALRIAAEYSGPIDLLLTDVVMPLMGGPELAGRLQATRPSLEVLYMSGYTDHALLRRNMAGPDPALLQKPFEQQVLLKAVSTQLRSHSEHRLSSMS